MGNYDHAPRLAGGMNYWCTWSAQWALSKRKLSADGKKVGYFEGENNARACVCEETVFGEDGFAYQFPEVRGDLFLLMDDGWDVPLDGCAGLPLSAFGSLIPDSGRFPSFPGTPVERLKGINDKLREIGWKGLGLWISPTMNGKEQDFRYEDHREAHEEYWKERVLWCKEAGVHYWKVDWGTFGHGDIVEYRRMISRIGKTYFPELIIEQTTCSAPYNGIPEEGKTRYQDYDFTISLAKQVVEFCDVYRTYDVTDDMLSDTTTLDRLSWFLPFAPCVMSCEDALYTGAALGCALGVMRSHYGKDYLRMNRKLDEVYGAVKWQRYAPSFAGGELNVSDDLLSDTMFFGPLDTWNNVIRNREVTQQAPAVMARNTPLPTVVRQEKMPFVIASRNPTGAYSLAAIRRREFLFDTPAPTVACQVGEAKRVGVFGDFKEITLQFDRPPVKMYVQSLIRGEEKLLDIHKYLTERTVKIPQDLLESMNEVTDESDNAVMFRFEF